MAAFQMRGSNWRFRRVMKLEVNTVVYKPLRGSSFIPLPVKLAFKKGIVNMKNNIDIISLNTLKIDEMLKFLTFNIYFRLFSYKKNKK